MTRFFLTPESWQSGILTGDEARHLSQVLRIKTGESVTVFDGCGKRARAEVLTTSRDEVSLRIGGILTTLPPRPAITLAQAIPKGKNMDLIVQKAVELGVAAIQPLVTQNTIVHPGEGKPDKWRRTALEACKQCGQDTLPAIADPLPIGRWLESGAGILPAADHLKLIASLAAGAKPLRETLRAHPGTASVTLLIGPEGDFTGEESHAALAAGFLPVSLGEIVLRVETAALFCLSALRYEFSARTSFLHLDAEKHARHIGQVHPDDFAAPKPTMDRVLMDACIPRVGPGGPTLGFGTQCRWHWMRLNPKGISAQSPRLRRHAATLGNRAHISSKPIGLVSYWTCFNPTHAVRPIPPGVFAGISGIRPERSPCDDAPPDCGYTPRRPPTPKDSQKIPRNRPARRSPPSARHVP